MPTRLIYDADSHIMEPVDWLDDYVDASVRSELELIPIPFTKEQAEEIREQRRADPEKESRARQRQYGKTFQAYGAWDGEERSRALDILGFSAQLVFATFTNVPVHRLTGDLLWDAARGLNRGLNDFCSSDARLLPVAYVPMSDPERAIAEVDAALAEGAACVQVAIDGVGCSPSHVDFDPLWARLQEAGIPFVTHLGGATDFVPNDYNRNGLPKPKDMVGGGETLRARDLLGTPFWPGFFLGVMAIDGVFERFPELQAGVIEQGGEWLVTALRQADHAHKLFVKKDENLQKLTLTPSEYIRRQVKVTPFYHEDLAWMIDQLGVDMLMFSSDYPHVEGGPDPIGRFDAGLEGCSTVDVDRFFSGNFARMMGKALDNLPAPAA